jgi:hypothetical protein
VGKRARAARRPRRERALVMVLALAGRDGGFTARVNARAVEVIL